MSEENIMVRNSFIIGAIILFLTGAGNVYARDAYDLPGTGAGDIAVNPHDGSIWIFFHQSMNLAALDPSGQSVLLDIDLPIAATAMAFHPADNILFVTGEPLDDQRISEGVVYAIDTITGDVLAQKEILSACNSICAASDGYIYVSTGMQYGYPGTIYKMIFIEATPDEETGADSAVPEFIIEYETECGKIPWAILEDDGIVYVTDLELQWAAQEDGSMGPPYGAWVWAYNSSDLEYIGSEWVGINPTDMVKTEFGILVACAGRKQTDNMSLEPAITLIAEPGTTVPIIAGTAGAGDIAVSPDGSWAIASLSNWAPPVPGSDIARLQQLNPERFPDARRWVFTGDIAWLQYMDERIDVSIHKIIGNGYLTSIDISADGKYIYGISGDPEKLLVIPIEDIESTSDYLYDAEDWRD
jgi:hypothetical protein